MFANTEDFKFDGVTSTSGHPPFFDWVCFILVVAIFIITVYTR